MDRFPWNDPDAGDDQCHQENLARRQALEEKFCTRFAVQLPTPHESSESWLQRLEFFEDELDRARRIPVRTYLNEPQLTSTAALKDDEAVAEELDALLDLLALHYIYVDCLTEVSDRELYRFIVEELMEEETAALTVPSMNCHFIYEDFHPNAEYDSKMWSEHFLYALLNGDEQTACSFIAKDDFVSGQGVPIPLPALLVHLRHFWSSYTSLYDVKVSALACTVDGDTSSVEAAVSWTGLPYQATEPVRVVGRAMLALRRMEDGFWDVTQATVPGVLDSIGAGMVSLHNQYD